MERISLLVVEDDAAATQSWEIEIERHNASVDPHAEPSIKLRCARTRDEALAILEDERIDAVVIDLRLDGNHSNPDDASGNDVLQAVLEKEPAVVTVFTGEPAGVVIPEYATGQVKVVSKGAGDGEGTPAVMDWIRSQFSLITCMKQARSLIERHTANVFTKSVWPRWKFWIESGDTGSTEIVSAALARHITSHVHEQLSQRMQGSAHAEEWYLLPADTSLINTGDLIRRTDGVIEIVITPRCDLATRKYETIQLAECQDISAKWDECNTSIAELEASLSNHEDPKAAEKARTDLDKLKSKQLNTRKELASHSKKTSQHFLPRMNLSNGTKVGPLFVRFDRIRSMEKPADSDTSTTLTGDRFATLSPVFLPSLVERLGTFFSRIGTPDYHHT